MRRLWQWLCGLVWGHENLEGFILVVGKPVRVERCLRCRRVQAIAGARVVRWEA